MLTEKDYCDYDTCVALKELGYPEHEILTYDFNLLLYEAQKWLREEKDIHIEIPIWLTDNGVWKYNFRLQTREFYDRAIGEWDTYEEALSEGLRTAIEILKEKR